MNTSESSHQIDFGIEDHCRFIYVLKLLENITMAWLISCKKIGGQNESSKPNKVL